MFVIVFPGLLTLPNVLWLDGGNFRFLVRERSLGAPCPGPIVRILPGLNGRDKSFPPRGFQRLNAVAAGKWPRRPIAGKAWFAGRDHRAERA